MPGCLEGLAQLRAALGEVRPALEVHRDDSARAEDLRGLRPRVRRDSVR